MIGDGGHLPELSPADQRVLDTLIDSGFDLEALSGSPEEQLRAAELMRLLGKLDDYPVSAADPALVDATMALVEQEDRNRGVRMRLEPDSQTRDRGLRIRLPDFITVAAVLLIGLGISIPLMSQIRSKSIDAGCANNMRVLSYAFDNYQADYRGELPLMQAGVGGSFVSLASMIDFGYCESGHINCPGHDGHLDGYSTGSREQWMAARAKGRTVMVGDHNPVLDAERDGRKISPRTIATSHGGRGQNVMSSDASVMWLDLPIVGGDNIWIQDRFNGRKGEVPGVPDIFLRH